MADDDLTDWDKLGYPKPAQNIPSKQQMRDVYRTYWLPKMMPLLQAQEAKALGVKHLLARNEKGEFKRVSDLEPEALDALLAGGWALLEVHMHDPDQNAIQSILSYCLDKPKEQEQEVIVHDGDRIRERLEAWKREHRNGE